MLPLGAAILDFGSGRKPTLDQGMRPMNCRYIGLDPAADELVLAGPEAYTESFVAPIESFIPELEEQIDLAISWQVLEHVEDISQALANIHAYLKPGGTLVSMLSGRNASFAVINRLIPERIGVFAMERLLRRPPDTVFRANYDGCTYDGLSQHLSQWSTVEIVPHYRGAGYFAFSGLTQRAYLSLEDRIVRHDKRNWATHYVIRAVK